MMQVKFRYLFLLGCLVSSSIFADSCQEVKSMCVDPGGTRYIEGVPVTLPCWKYETIKQCSGSSDNNCKDLRSQSCVQIGSKCREMIGDICVVQDETYNCPVQKCEPGDGIVCGGQFFCMNGDCSAKTPAKSTDENFGKGVAGLAAIGAAAADIRDSNGVKAFGGDGHECSEDMLGFKNCCDDSGWGKDLLAHCTDEEKQLYLDKDKKKTTYVGEYCYSDPLGICTSHHKVYCTFGSKLARIVQEQGRRDQLKRPFGSVGDDYNHVDCSGLTPDDLKKIDFRKIEFGEVYDDLKNNTAFPNSQAAQGKAIDRVKDFYEHNKKHD